MPRQSAFCCKIRASWHLSAPGRIGRKINRPAKGPKKALFSAVVIDIFLGQMGRIADIDKRGKALSVKTHMPRL